MDASLRPLQAYVQNVRGNWALLIVSALKGSEPSAPCTGLANVLNGHTVETDETSSPHNSPLDRAPGKYAWRYM